MVKQDQRAERITHGNHRSNVEQIERSTPDERFRRSQRLRSSLDFQRVRRRGRHLNGVHLSLSYAHRPREAKPAGDAGNAGDAGDAGAAPQPSRIGFSVSKRVGNAVTRNLVKRRLREATRRQLARLASGWDIILTARPSAAEATYQALAQEIADLLIRAHLIAHPGS